MDEALRANGLYITVLLVHSLLLAVVPNRLNERSVTKRMRSASSLKHMHIQ